MMHLWFQITGHTKLPGFSAVTQRHSGQSGRGGLTCTHPWHCLSVTPHTSRRSKTQSTLNWLLPTHGIKQKQWDKPKINKKN